MDRHGFRDIFNMLTGARRRRVEEWRHTLAVCQSVMNLASVWSPKNKAGGLFDLHKAMFPEEYGQPVRVSLDEYRRRSAEVEAAQRERERRRK